VKNNLLTLSDDYRTYDGLEVTTNIQLPKRAFLFSSLTAGKTHTYACTGGGVNRPVGHRTIRTTCGTAIRQRRTGTSSRCLAACRSSIRS